MSDEELMENIKNIQGLLWRPFVDELLIRSKKWFQDRDHAAYYIKQLEREVVAAIEVVAESGRKRGVAEAKLAKAVEAMKMAIKMWQKSDNGDLNIRMDNCINAIVSIVPVLAELEGKE